MPTIHQGRWWFKQRVLTKDGALSSTAELFFHNLIEDISFPALLALIASALEIKTILAAKSSSKKQKRNRQTQTEALEKKVRAEAERLGMGDVLAAGWESEKGKGVVLPNPHNRRAVALLWTHLLRIEDIEAELLDGKSSKDRVHGGIRKLMPPALQNDAKFSCKFRNSFLRSSMSRSPTTG